MAQRHHLPIGLVDAVKRSLSLSLSRVGSQLFACIGYLVHRNDGTTHEDGLRQHDGTCKHVSRVRTESVDDASTKLVKRSCYLLQVGTQLLLQGCRKNLGVRANTGLNACGKVSTQTIQSILLLVVQQRYLLTGVHVAAQCRDVWQILGTCRLAHIGGYFLLDTRDAHLLVVAQRHSPTTVKAQQALSSGRSHHACQQDKT